MNLAHYFSVWLRLKRIDERLHTMALDLSKLTASEAALVVKVDALLSDRQTIRDQLKAVSDQLAAANDPAAVKAAQDAVDKIAADMDAEAAKIDLPIATPSA